MLNGFNGKPATKRDAIKEGWTACFRCGGHGYAMLPQDRRETCYVCNGYGLLHPNDIQKYGYLQESSSLGDNKPINDAKIEVIAQAEIAKKRGRPANKLRFD